VNLRYIATFAFLFCYAAAVFFAALYVTMRLMP
jgi:hypothetical protein